MADKFSSTKRSEIMSHISGKETKLEVLVRKLLFTRGLRYRKNVKSLPGKPDIVLPKYRTVIFINGCFWHGHGGCLKSELPEIHRDFWKHKIAKSVERDKENEKSLRTSGWNVIVVWQCELSNRIKLQKRMELLVKQITSNI